MAPSREPLPAAELLAAIVNSSDDAIVSKDLDGIVTSWNRSAERIFGYTSAEMIGKNITVIFPTERIPEERTIQDHIRAGIPVDHFETQRQRKDGQLIDVSVTISPIRSKDGIIVGASKVARDITEQKVRTRAADLLAAIVASSDDAIISKDLQGNVTSWNQAAERMYGYGAEEIVGQPILLVVPSDRREEEQEILAKIRAGERVVHFETFRRRKNGELFPVSLTISPVKESSGTIVGASKIARDITEHRRIFAEREQLLESERTARSHAELASRMKDDFLATVSHELRTPLNAIVGWVQVLKESAVDPDVMEAVDTIERNANSQARLVDDLLDLGRISSGKLMLDVHPVDLQVVVRDAIDAVRHAAAAKNLEIKTIIDDGRGILMGDASRLQQVVWNLLSNAIKFSKKYGRITVSIRRVGSQIEVQISDNGVGITAEFLPHVFERFRQADESTTRRTGGLGIGLALVKHIVELHGGSARAESPGPGNGSTFTVALPIVAVRPGKLSMNEPDSQPLSLEDLSGITILAVDDDNDSLEVMRRILEARHAVVHTASSVDESLALLSSRKPDLILSDIGMPGGDGYELIRRIRALPDFAKTPAAAITALARSEDRMRALNAGFQTHIAKPVAPAELVAVVKSLATVRR